MRMVVEISEELHGRLKKKAKTDGRTVVSVLRELIEKYLEKEEKK